MKTFLKIFTIILLAQLFGNLSLASTCLLDGKAIGAENTAMNESCKGCIDGGGTWDDKTTCQSTNSGGSPVNLVNPIKANSVPELVGNIINVALGIVGSLALIMFIYGGFVWMLAAGNEQAVEKGKNVLVWATIGLVVIFASYSLVNFIINTAIVGK